jgi:hypothetical protein
LRQLRRLVTALTVTLILGVITIVGLLVIRLGSFGGALPLPDEIHLPPGESARAITLGTDWIAVVTVDRAGREHVRVLDRDTGADRGSIEIEAFE